MERILIGVLTVLGAFTAGSSSSAMAGQVAQNHGDTRTPITVHGFISQGFIKTDKNNFLASSKNGSFEYSEAGINFTGNLSDNMSVGMQLVAVKLGADESDAAEFDWYYIDYRWKNWLGLRTGRIKIPFGLYNERQDIDSARTPVLLPQSVYPFGNRDFLLAQNGIELYGFVNTPGMGSLDYRFYVGTISLDIGQSGEALTVSNLRTEYLAGTRLLWETPVRDLKVGATVQALQLNADLRVGTAFAEAEVPALLWIASAEYATKNFLLAAEYSRWNVEIKSSDPAVFPESSTLSERFYVLGTYPMTEIWTSGAYYSVLFRDVDDRGGAGNFNYDLALFARVDINLNWLVKFEWHFMRGTAGLQSSLNDNRPLSELRENWKAFLIKTTGYF